MFCPFQHHGNGCIVSDSRLFKTLVSLQVKEPPPRALSEKKERFTSPKARKDTEGAHKIEERAQNQGPKGWNLGCLPGILLLSKCLCLSLLVDLSFHLFQKDLPRGQETWLPQPPV